MGLRHKNIMYLKKNIKLKENIYFWQKKKKKKNVGNGFKTLFLFVQMAASNFHAIYYWKLLLFIVKPLFFQGSFCNIVLRWAIPILHILVLTFMKKNVKIFLWFWLVFVEIFQIFGWFIATRIRVAKIKRIRIRNTAFESNLTRISLVDWTLLPRVPCCFQTIYNDLRRKRRRCTVYNGSFPYCYYQNR